MNDKQAYQEGYNNGYRAALYCDVNVDDQENAGCNCKRGKICPDCLSVAAYESEINARDFSPWEFTAHDINESEYSEDLWGEYDRGVTSGIKAGTKERAT